MSDFNVRLVTKKQGLEMLKDDIQFNYMLSQAEITKSFADLIYVGWKELNSESYFLLQQKVQELENNDISYRMTTIGEEIDNIYEDSYTATGEQVEDIPFPSLIRDFDEKDMEQQLEGYEAYQKNYEEIEYE